MNTNITKKELDEIRINYGNGNCCCFSSKFIGDKKMTKATSKEILNYLINFAQNLDISSSHSKINVSYLAEIFGCSRRTIQRKIKVLIEKGYLTRVVLKINNIYQYETRLNKNIINKNNNKGMLHEIKSSL